MLEERCGEDVECNFLANQSRCMNRREGKSCPCKIDSSSIVNGCAGRIRVGSSISKPYSCRLLKTAPICAPFAGEEVFGVCNM
jgi:hypothetical protein